MARRRLQTSQRGAALLIFMILVVTATLTYLVNSLTPETVAAKRAQQTSAALAQARDALIGYALRYRDEEAGQGRPDRMYGYLPLPDMGSSRNNNTDPNCKDASNNPLEGCDANTPTGITCDANNIYPTMIGRLPWRTLGTGPLRDGHGECLWLIVSSLHLRKHCSSPTLPPMNWDTLGQLDIVTANGTSALNSALATHDRPLAIIFSPGPPLPGQDRCSDKNNPAECPFAQGNDISQCGGNYNATNYLDPAIATALGGVTNYLAGTAYLGQNNHESGTTGDSDLSNDPDDALKKSMLAQGKTYKSGTNYLSGGCAGSDCSLLANDTGLSITSDQLFGAIRNSAYFHQDINSMLDRMVSCLRDQFLVPGKTFYADSINGYTSPSGKIAGRLPDADIDNDSIANTADADFPATGIATASTCYDDAINPMGYFSHYKDLFFVAKPTAGNFTVSGASNCAGVLLFAGQRGAKLPVPVDAGESATQLRHAAAVSATNLVANNNWPANYLEDPNLASFTGAGTVFAGPDNLGRVKASKSNPQDILRCAPGGVWRLAADCQTAEQDIVRCIPAGASFAPVTSPGLNVDSNSDGIPDFSQLSGYDPATRTLTLGALGVNTGAGAPAWALYGCSWTPETHQTGSGLRAYFRFQVADRGDGFVFALIDGDHNSSGVCGAAHQHLGYSGNNDPDQTTDNGNETPPILQPKIGIELDRTRAGSFDPASLSTWNSGRNDPDYTPPQDNDAHAAIIYWGAEASIATGVACNAAGQCPVSGSNCNTLGNCPAVRYCAADNSCYWRAEFDDNQHGVPVPPDVSIYPAPRNPPAVDPYPSPAPSPATGLVSLDRFASTVTAERDFHVRVELTRTHSSSTYRGTYKIEVWVLPESPTVANQIELLKTVSRPISALSASLLPTLSNDGIRLDEPQNACVAGICPAGQTCQSGTCYTNGPVTIHDLAMGACDAQQRCNGPPLLKRAACGVGRSCPTGQSCGSDDYCYDALYVCGADNICHAEAFRTLRLGFTNGGGTQDQVINITDFATTWLP